MNFYRIVSYDTSNKIDSIDNVEDLGYGKCIDSCYTGLLLYGPLAIRASCYTGLLLYGPLAIRASILLEGDQV